MNYTPRQPPCTAKRSGTLRPVFPRLRKTSRSPWSVVCITWCLIIPRWFRTLLNLYRMYNMMFDQGGAHDQYRMLVGKGLKEGAYFPSLLEQPTVTVSRRSRTLITILYDYHTWTHNPRFYSLLTQVSRLPRTLCFNQVPCFLHDWAPANLISARCAPHPCWVCPGELDIVQVISIITIYGQYS